MYPRSIYEIKHLQTGRMYIGSSNDVMKRWKRHLWELQSGSHPVEEMQRDYDRYGDEYSFSIIGHIADESEDHKEYDCMLERCSNVRGLGYNYKDKKCPRATTAMMEKRLLEIVRNSKNPDRTAKIATAICYAVLFKKSIEEVTGTKTSIVRGDGECRILYG